MAPGVNIPDLVESGQKAPDFIASRTRLNSLKIGERRSLEYTAVAVAAFERCLASTALECSERPYLAVHDINVDFNE
jgi:hypothetical protein